MFREAIGLFVPEPKAKLYIPKNSGLHEYVNNLLSEIGVSDGGEFTRTDESVGTLEIISARGRGCAPTELTIASCGEKSRMASRETICSTSTCWALGTLHLEFSTPTIGSIQMLSFIGRPFVC